MNDDRNAASGSCARIFSIAVRNRSPFPHRFMRRNKPADACCNERSKYGTTVGSSNIVVINGSRTSDGYR